MIVTELETTAGDLEGYTTGEVIEFPETENQPANQVFSSVQYYIEDEEETNKCCNSIIQELVSSDLERESPKCLVIEEENPSEFNMESFTKTFKTLVDIVTDPIIEECPSVSSTNSESSEDSFSLLPALRTLSTKFITKTSKMFKLEEPDLINLHTSSQSSEKSQDSVERIAQVNDEEELASDTEVGGVRKPEEFRNSKEEEAPEPSKLRSLSRWF